MHRANTSATQQAQTQLVLAEQLFTARNFPGAKQALIACDSSKLSTALQLRFLSLYGTTLLELKQATAALEPLKAALAAQKSNAEARMLYATALHLSGDLPNAEKQYREVLRLVPSAENTELNLARVLDLQGDSTGAIRMLTGLVSKKPQFKDAHVALADLFATAGREADAANSINQALQIDPQYAPAWRVAGRIAERSGNLQQAHDCYLKSTNTDPRAGEGWFLLGSVQARLGSATDALASFKRAHEAEPNDEKFAFMYKQASATDTGAQMPESYVRELFDQYAHTFDKSLVEGLGYQTPARIAEAIAPWLSTHPARTTNPPSLRVLDLGCGTGLMGPLLAPVAATLVGVDLSPKMLEKAQVRGYTALHAAELVTFLQSSTEASYDLIVATDVFNYFGDLSAVFAAARQVIAPSGLFAFSVEALPSDADAPFRLGASSRFQHQESYIRALAAQSGLHVQSATRATLRKESTHEVEGILFALSPA
jgi:predicted TPR repeat methyltransferase